MTSQDDRILASLAKDLADVDLSGEAFREADIAKGKQIAETIKATSMRSIAVRSFIGVSVDPKRMVELKTSGFRFVTWDDAKKVIGADELRLTSLAFLAQQDIDSEKPIDLSDESTAPGNLASMFKKLIKLGVDKNKPATFYSAVVAVTEDVLEAVSDSAIMFDDELEIGFSNEDVSNLVADAARWLALVYLPGIHHMIFTYAKLLDAASGSSQAVDVTRRFVDSHEDGDFSSQDEYYAALGRSIF